jgi:ABC-type branched-subunit amino acid transport system ATPase component
MFDEPSEGIMAVLVKIEQNVEIALGLSDRTYILDPATMGGRDSPTAEIRERYCSI